LWCGEIGMVKSCVSCGMNVPDDARFCSWCGVSSEVIVAVAAPVGVPVARAVASPVPVTGPAVVGMPAVVPTIALPDEGQRRLRFCNRCGIKIPFGAAKTYMGLVMCANCFEVEPIPTTIPTIPIPMFA
jgi:NMD protein affecting ribosome stability and mRNA decay